ncbi:MAG: epimerase [Chitinophagaceae bacterium]|nr:epimerase [Chitinophagaceae bacterium]
MNRQNLKVIITGTTGMVGEGVLHECLNSADIAEVLIINRKALGLSHPKLNEIIHADFYNMEPIAAQLSGYDACFFCLGVSSVGMKANEYYKATYTLTLHVAGILSRVNTDMTFCYVSGAGTDETESGRSEWARVKGKTENDIAKLPFRETFAFRPGFIKPTQGLTRTHNFYKYVNWLFPIGRAIYPKAFCTMKELGVAMINVAKSGYSKRIIEGNDIIALGRQ